MSDYHPSSRRPIADMFRKTAHGATRLCVRMNIHPDAISISSIFASAAAGACFIGARWHPWLLLIAPLFCYVRLWFNMLDGMVALAANKASSRGEILNELPDRISDALVFATVAMSGWCTPTAGYMAAIFALLTAYVGVLGQAVGARREFGGVMSKPWRMVVLHLGAWTAFFVSLSAHGPHPHHHLWWPFNPPPPAPEPHNNVLTWTCWIVVAGCVQTMFVRLRSTFKLLAKQGFSEPEASDFGELSRAATEFAASSQTPPPHGTSTSHTFRSHDGAELFYRAWLPPEPTTRALILFHRGHEHSARFQETVDRLDLKDVAIFAWDQRGHGLSPGARGSAEDLSVFVKDADVFVKHLVSTHGIRVEETIILAHSVGGVIATAWVHDYAPPIRGLILAAPAFRVKLYVPLAIPLLRLKQKLLGGGYVKSYVKSKVLTHDPAEQSAYDNDKLIFRQIAVNILLDLFDTSTRLLADAGAITVPTLILAAGSDWVVKESAQWQFFDRLSSPIKQMEVFRGFYHALFHETHRAKLVDRIRRFTVECFDRVEESRASLLTADQGGYTRSEYDRLRAPGGPQWGLARGFLNTIGRLSDGITLGHESGFDSGLTLDYVYENCAHGTTPLGKFIDWFYLNSIGWRGIRIRREHLQQMLHRAIAETTGPIEILDIAAGAGRYVLETIAPMKERTIGVTLRDYRQANLDAARKLADSLQLPSIRTLLGDAFDRESLAATDPKPTIAIVSGLYELFPENEPLRRSLAGIADALPSGGLLIYTCQPWHPQVEFIARVLTNREGQPWVMRRRTQAEMDALVYAAGFEKVDQAIDQWGIFTVSMAKKA